VSGDGRDRRGKPAGSGNAAPGTAEERGSVSLRPLETKILISAGVVLAGIAVAGRYGMLPGAACGAAIAYANVLLLRRILGRAFSGEEPAGKGFLVPYVLKVFGLAALVYLVVRSGRFDVLGFLLGFSALFLGVLFEGLSRAAGTR
jgi:hypothetical protein